MVENIYYDQHLYIFVYFQFPLMDLWEEFLRKEHGAAITKDTWNLLLDFCFNIKPDLSNYDDDGLFVGLYPCWILKSTIGA